MLIMKFGGTSVQDARSVRRVIHLIQERLSRRPVIVISAMGKTTRKLLGAAELAAGGDASAGLAQLTELRAYHGEIIHELSVTAAQAHVETYFSQLERLLNGLSVVGELTPRGRDRIAAYGELISSTIVAEALKQAGLNAVWLDAREFLITDDTYTRARPLLEVANPKIVEHLRPHLEAGRVPVTQGYIGSTPGGITTTLGFEGSDYTAAIIGAALDAEDIQIWTDVNGIMTADPALVPQARTVKVLSVAEAKELTHFGAKVLHPKTLFPAQEKAIPVHIYNSRQPDAPGTVILTQAPSTRTPIKSIAYKRPVSLVRITPRGLRPRLQFFKQIFEALERSQLVTYLAAISELDVVLAIDPSEAVEALKDAVKPEAQVIVTSDQAIICLVGEHLNQIPGLTAQVFQALTDLRLRLIVQGASAHSLVLIVRAVEVEKALGRLHEQLFQSPDPDLFS